MTTQKVLAGLLEPGDVICVQHHHDARCGECLAPWQTQAVITGRPAPVSGRLVVNWAAGTRPPGGRGAVTGVSVFSPGEQVVRIGQRPAAGPGALALIPRAAARLPGLTSRLMDVTAGRPERLVPGLSGWFRPALRAQGHW